MTRDEKAILFVTDTLNSLVKMGLLKGGALSITEQGKEAIEQMKREGFEPTQAEISAVIEMLKRQRIIEG